MFWIIVTMLIAVFVVLFIIMTFFPHFFTFGDAIKTETGNINTDSDGDGLTNFVDDCPCTSGDRIDNGCPSSFSDKEIKEDKEKAGTESC